MSVMSRRTTKTGMSRASTTATVRKRKQVMCWLSIWTKLRNLRKV
ncbi:unnamed protein product [Cylicostephanus goldi]|uniref:Uncharacterized protein n=1 Tax=Cylicostephanus goldi TaxID=71465 RepID=A0A3P6U9Q1_CYLGO|nr:unnamed protein product [Cylicostephanus goldi]